MLEKIREKYIANASADAGHDDGLAETMAEKIVLCLSEDLDVFERSGGGAIEFAAYLREYDLAKAKHGSTWRAMLATRPEITAKSKSEGGRKAISIVSRQFYKAHHKLMPEEDYSGYFEVVAITYGTDVSDKKPEELLDPLAKIVCRLAHEHYREQISEYYPEWDTDYLNTVSYLIKPTDA